MIIWDKGEKVDEGRKRGSATLRRSNRERALKNRYGLE